VSNRIVGIDLGSRTVRGVELKNADRAKPVVVKFAEVALPEGSVRGGEVLEVGTVSTALRRLWAAGKFSTKDVVLGMGGPRVLSRELAMPKTSLARMREALPFHVQDLLPVPVADVLMDFYPISESPDEQGPMIHGLLVAAIKEAVTANVEAANRAGLRPVQVDLIPFALVRALAASAPTRGLTALVSIGANTTNVVLVQDGVPQFVRIIPAGGDDITRALVARLEMTPVQAETAKRELGFNPATPDRMPVSEVIYEVGGEQVNAIRNTLNYYTNSKPGLAIDRIVLSGGGAQLAGLMKALSELTAIPVMADMAASHGFAQHERSGRSTRAQLEAMSTAYALALGSAA